MPFLTQYQIYFCNNEGENVTINISDTTSGAGTPTPIPLESASLAELKVINDTEDKFSTIKGKRLTFNFYPSVSATLTTFLTGSSTKWLVELYIGTTQLLSMYLVTEETKEAFQPISGRYPIILTASDNLGLLKDVALTKDDGTNPRGEFRIMDFISWSLKKTGFELPINVVANLKPEQLTTTAEHAFDEVWLSSKTWESSKQNVSVDCYEVLSKILKAFGSFLTQENNQWWIVRIDEINGDPLTVHAFDPDGVLGGDSTATFSKNIGKDETIKFLGKDADVMPIGPDKFDELTYNFEYPKEIIDNMDFSRGTNIIGIIVPDISLYLKIYANLGSFPVTGEFETTYKATDTGFFYKWTGITYVQITGAEAPTGVAYTLEDWSINRPGGGTPLTTPFIVKIRQMGDERARYLEIPGSASGQHWVMSNPIPVGRFDRFTFSVDRRLSINPAGNTQSPNATEFFAQVRLYSEDGSFWAIDNHQLGNRPPGSWVQTTASFPAAYLRETYNNVTGIETEWMSTGVDANPLPVAGELRICLMQSNVYGTTYATHFSNLQFQYYPYLLNSYEKYNSQIHKVSQDLETKKVTEETVFLADAPKKLFKGAMMLKTAGGMYYLTNRWYNGNAGTGGELGIASFGKYQAFEYWNQNRRVMRKIPGSLTGMDTVTPTDIPGLLHNYILTATSPHTTNKKFMLLSYSQNLDTCEWSGIFAEVMDTVEGKDYLADHEFKYTTDNE